MKIPRELTKDCSRKDLIKWLEIVYQDREDLLKERDKLVEELNRAQSQFPDRHSEGE